MDMNPIIPALDKRRKLSLLDTIRVRNGGEDSSFLTVANTPPLARESDGSDTEDEEDEEKAQYYLNKMSDDTERATETVFGKGVEVWKSMGGTVYADLTDEVKRKMREEELWGDEAREKIEGGLKRKVATDDAAKKSASFAPTKPDIPSVGEVFYHTLPSDITCPDLPSTNKTKFPVPPAPSPLPAPAYPIRNPTATQFHHSSAGIDPMGAYSWRIKPLPNRRVSTTISQHPFPGPGARLWGPLSLLHQQHHQTVGLVEQQTVRRIVSGSFGSFEGAVGRFDERAYRLGVKADNKESGEEKLDPFKGRPWLRR
ncbi:hypothetical protein DE146DRAFT_770042 [Phaeosphaeria sp. MPI-PUGE-AT-0046c]|nr:hypothetical protein DE146DRAFT_770042 [Phaeosphaeria sp. MPI-PUGE-AT-0046c]